MSTSANSSAPGYNCTLCARFHPFSVYVLAHRFEHFTHRCECGAQHDIYDGEASLIDRLAKPAVTDWITDTPPALEGYYHIRFPNGTEADRNWYWNGSAFAYDKGSPVVLQFGSIGGYRGLTRRYE
jgi:hypothetical protein